MTSPLHSPGGWGDNRPMATEPGTPATLNRPEKASSKARTARPFWRQAQPFLLWLDGPPEHPEPWYDVFLKHYAVNGSKVLAGMKARTGRTTVWRAEQHDPGFKREMESAWLYYLDRLEWEHVHLGRTAGNTSLPYFGRLKAELPAKYDRQTEWRYLFHESNTVNVYTNQALSQEALSTLLRGMLADASDATLYELHGHDPRQLPEFAESGPGDIIDESDNSPPNPTSNAPEPHAPRHTP
jgi:hypothetical protein